MCTEISSANGWDQIGWTSMIVSSAELLNISLSIRYHISWSNLRPMLVKPYTDDDVMIWITFLHYWVPVQGINGGYPGKMIRNGNL